MIARRLPRAWAALLLLAIGGVPALLAGAQVALTTDVVPATDAPGLGRVVRGTSASVFTINASTGAVTRTSGNAARITSSTPVTPTVTIRCTNAGTNCTAGGRRYTVTVQAGSAAGAGASVTNLTITTPSGATVVGGPTYASGTLTFVVSGFSTLSIRIGMSLQVPASGSTGVGTVPFTVNVIRTA
jgi:hypothetical protein